MTKKRQPQAPAAAPHSAYTIQRKERSRFWEVIDPTGELVCLTVYKRGAVEVVRRLNT
jgi:hypothetical protein